jgi:putative hydroxymethylpyrimidine transport system ATP-binding protein
MTGRPARLSPPMLPPGEPPRDAADTEILRMQAELLRRLATEAP